MNPDPDSTARPPVNPPAVGPLDPILALATLADRQHRAGRLSEAADAYRQILCMDPFLAEVHNNLGNVLRDQGRLDDALLHFQKAAELKPTLLPAHNNLGNVLKRQRKLEQAVAAYQVALSLNDNLAEVHNNLGAVLREQGKLDEGRAHLEQALALKPAYPEAHLNLGNLLRDRGQIDEAAARYRQALALKPDYAEAQFSLGLIYLLVGDYERGWPGYEARLRLPEARLRLPEARLRPTLPRWTGQPLAGRTLLLLAEQGLGDLFQFIRYARRFKQRGARVVLACKSVCRQLLTGQPDIDELVLTDAQGNSPRCDFYLPLLSSPGALGTTLSTIPREVPYLFPDPDLSARWRDELAAIEGFKIGIAWQGSPNFRMDRQRSLPLAHFAALARLPGVRLVSLQKGFGAEQIATVDFPVIDFSDRLDEAAGPFMDTAALMCNVDLVVTSDTSVPHLAGALGVPVWVALHFTPDWRFLLARDDCPWYPSMRLFRQKVLGQWPDVFQRIAQAVGELRSAQG